MAAANPEGRSGGRTSFGHPIGLTNLFGVELWERFSCCPPCSPNCGPGSTIAHRPRRASSHEFAYFGVVAIGVGAIAVASSGWVSRLMEGVR